MSVKGWLSRTRKHERSVGSREGKCSVGLSYCPRSFLMLCICQENQQRGFQGLYSFRTLWGGLWGWEIGMRLVSQPLFLLPLDFLPLKLGQSYKQ